MILHNFKTPPRQANIARAIVTQSRRPRIALRELPQTAGGTKNGSALVHHHTPTQSNLKMDPHGVSKIPPGPSSQGNASQTQSVPIAEELPDLPPAYEASQSRSTPSSTAPQPAVGAASANTSDHTSAKPSGKRSGGGCSKSARRSAAGGGGCSKSSWWNWGGGCKKSAARRAEAAAAAEAPSGPIMTDKTPADRKGFLGV